MLHRSTAYRILAWVLLVLVGTGGIVYWKWDALVDLVSTLSPSVRWLTLFGLVLVTQMIIGYLVWWLLRRQPASVVQTEVLNSIVHEFQTPISAIRMSADILDSPIARDQPERTQKYVRIIREETERLQQQVETMLTLARADRNTLVVNPEPIQLHHLLRSVAERHGDYLKLTLAGTDPHLLADRLHITNVFYNLLDNAIKYSVGEPEITIQTTTNRDGLTIAIKDRGVGIPPKLVSQIFQPFFRVHDRNQPSVKGFGLGLSYVQRIIHAHKWSIWVKSEVGKGSEFMIQIPPSSLLPPTKSNQSLSSKTEQ
ncbi:HAMP domain-containing histidine kinase [Spirosoma sp. BT702]|uniref:histidine kinase n=1 Tax=Spirosoma profusum TaxID=2771354 RepID=A0A926XXB2_9BACT|nr:HAMP domain-containing sensor histidine kinase [Spirosoma profusum]MBD2702412.1 HAMP domain-containing histidine kinase [Spirosoma profusum]